MSIQKLTINNDYTKVVRSIQGKIEMAFYENSEDNDADIYINRNENNDSKLNDFIEATKKQIISTGYVPKNKCFTADGLSYPNNTFYPINYHLNTIIPLWSDALSNATGLFNQTKPLYKLTFPATRKINQFMIIGDEKLEQFPKQYTFNIFVLATNDGFNTPNLEPIPSGNHTLIDFKTLSSQAINVVIDNKPYKKYSFSINLTSNPTCKQLLVFSTHYQANIVEMEIDYWSQGGTTSKIMFFSNDMRIVCDNKQMQSINVLEEKSSEPQDIGYGITANSCTVKVQNYNNRFIINKDLLKKNRIIKPFIKEANDNKWHELGKFYSSEWEVSSSSSFVSCKAYDILYNLQNLYIYYDMEKDESGNYVIDGTVNSKNGNAFDIIKKIFVKINLQRKINGIFGAEIKEVINEAEYSGIKFDYVCLGYDTAWNILKKVANATQSFIYCNRQGDVNIVRDKFAGDNSAFKAEIYPCNAFNYNLPTMSQAIANRVTVPYFELVEPDSKDGVDKDDQFTIESKDFTTDEDGNKIITLELKNFYKSINRVERHFDKNFNAAYETLNKSITYTYNRIIINMGKIADQVLYLKVIPKSSSDRKVLKTYNHTYEDYSSQNKNGVVPYKLESEDTLYGLAKATALAKQIAGKYADGKPCIETDWRGTPLLELGQKIKSCSRQEPQAADYECLVNEFSFSDGLKVKTKARLF